ncbi:dUTP diphosphatase [Anaplasmataceae bacterium AB001_6]|nr:dUTP diphosphatase [Anaplasmataceae bacterium AB001_6]
MIITLDKKLDVNSAILKIKILSYALELGINAPKYATEGSAGFDVQAAITDNLTLKSGEIKIVPTGIAVEILPGYEIQVRPRSGMAIKSGVTIVNSPGTIDSDYRGEIKVGLINLGHSDFEITKGQRIAQLILSQYTRAIMSVCKDLSDTERGDKGFGSTGTH